MVLDLPAAEGATAAESAIATGYEITQDSPYYEMYMPITRKFQQPEVEEKKEEVPTRGEVFFDDDNEVPDDEEEKARPKLGKKNVSWPTCSLSLNSGDHKAPRSRCVDQHLFLRSQGPRRHQISPQHCPCSRALIAQT